jgi:hypothetical protein
LFRDPKFKFNAKAEEFVFHQVSVPQQQNVSAPPIYAAPVMYPPMSFAYGQQIPFVYGQQMMGGYNPAMMPQVSNFLKFTLIYKNIFICRHRFKATIQQ